MVEAISSDLALILKEKGLDLNQGRQKSSLMIKLIFLFGQVFFLCPAKKEHRRA